ncbi:MAG: hypothetical protein V4709_01395 [Pseudomonadota bacterium]
MRRVPLSLDDELADQFDQFDQWAERGMRLGKILLVPLEDHGYAHPHVHSHPPRELPFI